MTDLSTIPVSLLESVAGGQKRLTSYPVSDKPIFCFPYYPDIPYMPYPVPVPPMIQGNPDL